MKDRLQEELLQVGIEMEGLKLKIVNMVEKNLKKGHYQKVGC